MMRFFTQMHPKIPLRGLNQKKHPECLTLEKGKLVISQRNITGKTDKTHKGREEKSQMQMPGFVHPETMNDEGVFTQKAKQQIEEHKRKKEKPNLRENPDGGRE